MVLHAEDRQLAMPEALAGVVVEVQVRRLPAAAGDRRRIDGEVVVLRGDLDAPGV